MTTEDDYIKCVEDAMKELSLTHDDLAEKMGFSEEEKTSFFNARMGMNHKIAMQLAKHLGSTHGFWYSMGFFGNFKVTLIKPNQEAT